MKVICTNNFPRSSKLTEGKIYDVKQHPRIDDMYLLIDDSGVEERHYQYRFTPLRQYRREQIDRILYEVDSKLCRPSKIRLFRYVPTL